MFDRENLMARVREQAEKQWDVVPIKAWLDRVAKDGIPAKVVSAGEAVGRKQEVLDRVQHRAEDCTFLGRV